MRKIISIGIVLYVVAGVGLAIFGVLNWGIPSGSHKGIYVDGQEQSPAARGIPFWQHVQNLLINNAR